MFIGLGLAVNGGHPWLLAATCMLVAYTVAIISVMARGITTECGCFGTLHKSEANGLLIVRNSTMIAALAPSLVWHELAISIPLPGLVVGWALVITSATALYLTNAAYRLDSH
ncbi:MAG: hypothetical protein QM582_10430 [Micropruina sp.]|uniref:MauE/DoxX family redox-associated membrane protein n=1 Tax=Micropruina sp. TaxID=2737536 RepID=UPI0039E479CC